MSKELIFSEYDIDIYDYDAGGEIIKFAGTVWMEDTDNVEYAFTISGTHGVDDGTELIIDYITDLETKYEYDNVESIDGMEDTDEDTIGYIASELMYFLDEELESCIDENEDDWEEDDWEEDEQEWNELQYGGELEEDDE